MGDIRLGELLVQAGLISEEQLNQALRLQEQDPTHRRLGTILISLGLITEDHLCRALSAQLGLEMVDLSLIEIDERAVDSVPEQWAIRHAAVPVRFEGSTLYIATSDPTNRWLREDISQVTGLDIRLLVAPETDVKVHLRRQYDALRDRQKAEQKKAAAKTGSGAYGAALKGLDFSAGEQGAVEIVDKIVGEAVSRRASDIVLICQGEGVVVRFRIDGVFREVAQIPRSMQPSVISRIKIMGNLDVTEHRRPQDGRTRFEAGGQEVDVRIAVFPTMYGESVVLRILDRLQGLPCLDTLGLRPPQLELVMEYGRRPQGLILLTGPTGSGKTTTIYALLNEIYSPQLNILTLEDPVEYEMEGVGQVQIDEKAGLTFASGLKSFLRAAPNVILVGEIRDLETASLAFQAGLTGHLVLSTLHTNDAVSTVLRLLSMGVEPYLISSTLSLVVAQRLIRRVCPSCRRQLQPSPGILRMLRITEEQAAQHKFFGGTGCDKCEGSGYKGRIGVYEVLEINDPMRDVIIAQGRESELRRVARETGVRSLRQEALARAFQGHTTLEEVIRVTDVRENIEDRCPRCGLPLPGAGMPCAKCGVFSPEGTPGKKTAAAQARAAAVAVPMDGQSRPRTVPPSA